VVRVNYRGSTGHGAEWLNAALHDPGHAEITDIARVREYLVELGVIRPGRIALCGSSWGGYLGLLAAGVQPALWDAIIAEAPIADYETAFAEEMQPARDFDRYLFGGSPEDVPERYRRASPLTYVEQVAADQFIIAGRNDDGCTIGQVRNYRNARTIAGGRIDYHECDMGHGTNSPDEKVAHMNQILTFLNRVFGDLDGR
jgi:dipeptidyl aminopeptidase/acylaminoacyl peptidase